MHWHHKLVLLQSSAVAVSSSLTDTVLHQCIFLSSLSVRSSNCFLSSRWEWYLCRAWVQNVSSSFDIESSIGSSCCLMPLYALRIAIESCCMLLLRMSLFSENPLSTPWLPMWQNSVFALPPTIALHILASLQYAYQRTHQGSYLFSCTSKTLFSCTCPLLSQRPRTVVILCHQNVGFLACGISVDEEGYQICLLKILVCLPSTLGQGNKISDHWILEGAPFH